MRNTIRKEKKKISPAIVLIVVLAIIVGSAYLVLTNIIFTKEFLMESDEIPKSFVGYQIMYINNLANDRLDVVSKIVKYDPNIVIFNGRLTDKDGGVDKTAEAIRSASEQCPTAYVSDNAKLNELLEGSSAIRIDGHEIEVEAPEVDQETFISTYIEGKYLKKQDSDKKIKNYIEYTKFELERTKNSRIRICGFLSLGKNGANVNDEIGQVMKFGSNEFTIGVIGECGKPQLIKELGIALIGQCQGGIRLKDVESYNGVVDIEADGINPNTIGIKNIILITLSDGTINKENPLEKFIGLFVNDVGTRFDNDKGFSRNTKYYD